MTNRPKPVLVPVPPAEDGSAAERDPTASDAAARRRRRWQGFGLAVGALLLAVCAVGWLLEARAARELAGRVRALAASLATAEAELDARRAHLEAVRGAVAGVRGELDALADLVAREPAPEAPPVPAPVE